jgi:hypothetical protein
MLAGALALIAKPHFVRHAAPPATSASPAAERHFQQSSLTGRSTTDEISGQKLPTTRVTESPGTATSRTGIACTVRGRVLDFIDTPVENALVMLAVAPEWAPRDFLDRLDATGRLETTTDEHGRFELPGAPLKAVLLGVRHESYEPLNVRVDVSIHSSANDENCVEIGPLELKPGSTLVGRVVDERGNGVAGASLAWNKGELTGIAARNRRPAVHVAETAEDGHFQTRPIPVGPYKLTIASESFPTHVFEGDAHWGLETGRAFVLTEGSSIEGQVLGPENLDLTGLTVRATSKGETLTGACTPEGAFTLPSFRTRGHDAKYRFSLLWPDETLQGLAAPVSARTGDRNVELHLPNPAWIGFTPIDAERGEPLPVARVFLERWTGEQRLFVNEVTELAKRSDRIAGSVALPVFNLPTTADVPGTIGLRVHADGYMASIRRHIRLDAGETLELGTIMLRAQPTLTARVESAEGEPVEGAVIRMVERGSLYGVEPGDLRPPPQALQTLDVSSESTEGSSGPRGLAVMERARGEAWYFLASHPEYGASKPLLLTENELDETVTLTLRPGGTVVVRVTSSEEHMTSPTILHRYDAGDAESRIASQLPGGNSFHKTDHLGGYRFDGLPEGTHVFELEVRPGGKRISASAHVTDDSFEELALTLEGHD